MYYITLKKVPAEYKKIFEQAGFSFEKPKLFAKKSLATKQLDLFKANQGIKDVSNALDDGEEIKLTATVYDDEEEKDFELSDVTLPPKDKDSGIIGLVDQLSAKASSDSEIVKLESALYDELASDSSDDSDDNSEEFDDDDYQNDADDLDDLDGEPSNTEPESNYDDDMVLSSPQIDDDLAKSLFGDDSDNSNESTNNADLPADDTQAAQVMPVARPQLIDIASYINEQDLAGTDKDFSAENFDVMTIAKTLGMTENPADKYQQNINNAIWSSMDASGIREIKQSWIQNVAAEKSATLQELENEFSSATTQSVEDEAKATTAADIGSMKTDLEAKVSQEKQKAEDEIDAKRRQLASDTEAKIKAFKEELEKHDEETLADFDTQTHLALNEAIAKLEQDEENAENELLRSTEDAIVNARNKSLSKRKVEIIKDLRHRLTEAYKKKQAMLSDGVNQLSQAARQASEANLAMKEDEEKKQQAKESRAKTLALREKEIALKEKKAEEERKMREAELELKQKELAYKNEALSSALKDAVEKPDTQTGASHTAQSAQPMPAPYPPYPYPPYGYAPQGQMPAPYPYSPYGYAPQGQVPPASSPQGQNPESQGTSSPFGQTPQPVKQENKNPEPAKETVKQEEAGKEKEEKNESQNEVNVTEPLTKKEKRRVRGICALAVILAVGASVGTAVWNVEQKQGNSNFFNFAKVQSSKTAKVKETAVKASKEASASSSQSSSKKVKAKTKRTKKTVKKASKKASKKQAKKPSKKSTRQLLQDKQKASLKGFKPAEYSVYQNQREYLVAKTDKARLSCMDKMLKAKDLTTLGYLSKRGSRIARLYLAIANGQTTQAQYLWSNLTAYEKQSVSSYAASSLALLLWNAGKGNAAMQVMEENK